MAADGQAYESDRIMFLRSYLIQLQHATTEGAPVQGYFVLLGSAHPTSRSSQPWEQVYRS